MNSRIGRFFSLVIGFILGAFFLLVGGISLLLPWSSMLRTDVVQFILEGSLIFSLFGLGFTLIGLSLLAYTFLSKKRHYAYIRTGSRSITLDENVIRHYIESYWQEQFPKYHIPSDFKIKKNYIQIQADFPFLPKSEQKTFLEQIGHDFDDIFGRLLGYPHEIRLIASFQSQGQSADPAQKNKKAEEMDKQPWTTK